MNLLEMLRNEKRISIDVQQARRKSNRR